MVIYRNMVCLGNLTNNYYGQVLTGTEQQNGTSIRFRQRLPSVEGKHSVMFYLDLIVHRSHKNERVLLNFTDGIRDSTETLHTHTHTHTHTHALSHTHTHTHTLLGSPSCPAH